MLTDIHHIRLCYDKQRYCGHPRQGGIFSYGNGEIAVLHNHAPASYSTAEEISHSPLTGYISRSQVLLQRSLDHGATWPREHDVVVWDDSLPLAEKRMRLAAADDPTALRDRIDPSHPDAAVYFARPMTGPEDERGLPTAECYAFRSADRGRTWESAPTRVSAPDRRRRIHRDGHPLAVFPDGSLMGAMTLADPHVVAVYGSDDCGLTWEYLAEVARDPTGLGRPTYAGLLLLPNGTLQCYMLHLSGLRNTLDVAHSSDGGYSWSAPRPIVHWGRSPWRSHRPPDAYRAGVHYRSPWPMRLRDGRIVVLFARRKPPYGIGLILSEDDGATWSSEAILRADASGHDIGYPVAVELDDGRLFTAYYFMEADGNPFGGTRHIAGSFFKLA